MLNVGNSKVVKKLINVLLRIISVRGKEGVYISRGTSFATHVQVEGGTRVNGPAVFKGVSSIRIGRYCAIGHNVKFIAGNHDTSQVSQQVVLLKRLGVKSTQTQGGINIGSDVWIGDNVIILSNVNIGNGAIIGAGAVVTSDIPPFAIAVGVPAKVVKFRFEKSVIDFIEATEWWKLKINMLKKYSEFFLLDLRKEKISTIKDVWSRCEGRSRQAK